MRTSIIICFIVAAVIIPSLCRSQDKLEDSIIKQLQTGAEGFKERYHAPGFVIAIVHDKNIIFREALGYTDVEHKIPATVHSVFSTESVTKMFTATMLMQLVQRGVVKLDDPVKKYVPELQAKDDITLLQLATHSSGLPRNSPADINFAKNIDRWFLGKFNDTVIEAATKKEFLHSLGTIQKEYPDYQLLSYGNRHYSNMGYTLLGIALERAAGDNYVDYIIKNICRPLNMDNSSFRTERGSMDNVAKGYYYSDSLKDFITVPSFKPNSVMPAAGLYADATDMAKFISFQFEDNSGDLNKILSPKNKAMMQSFGIGWKQSYPFVFHEGAMLGYRCEIAVDPAIKLGWVILTNTTDFDFSRINRYISDLLVPVFTSKKLPDPAKFTGTYALDGGYGSLKIYLENGQLYSTYLEDEFPKVPLTPSGNGSFTEVVRKNYSVGYEFVADADGNIKALNLGQLMWTKQ